MPWHIKYGRWWMIQWNFSGWFSFGVHLDFKRRHTGKTGIPYGPYLDLHLFCFIFSIGNNPYYSTDGSD